MRIRKMWIGPSTKGYANKAAWLLKSEGGLDEETKEYLTMRGLDEVRLEEKEPTVTEWVEEEMVEPEHQLSMDDTEDKGLNWTRSSHGSGSQFTASGRGGMQFSITHEGGNAPFVLSVGDRHLGEFRSFTEAKNRAETFSPSGKGMGMNPPEGKTEEVADDVAVRAQEMAMKDVPMDDAVEAAMEEEGVPKSMRPAVKAIAKSKLSSKATNHKTNANKGTTFLPGSVCRNKSTGQLVLVRSCSNGTCKVVKVNGDEAEMDEKSLKVKMKADDIPQNLRKSQEWGLPSKITGQNGDMQSKLTNWYGKLTHMLKFLAPTLKDADLTGEEQKEVEGAVDQAFMKAAEELEIDKLNTTNNRPGGEAAWDENQDDPDFRAAVMGNYNRSYHNKLNTTNNRPGGEAAWDENQDDPDFRAAVMQQYRSIKIAKGEHHKLNTTNNRPGGEAAWDENQDDPDFRAAVMQQYRSLRRKAPDSLQPMNNTGGNHPEKDDSLTPMATQKPDWTGADDSVTPSKSRRNKLNTTNNRPGGEAAWDENQDDPDFRAAVMQQYNRSLPTNTFKSWVKDLSEEVADKHAPKLKATIAKRAQKFITSTIQTKDMDPKECAEELVAEEELDPTIQMCKVAKGLLAAGALPLKKSWVEKYGACGKAKCTKSVLCKKCCTKVAQKAIEKGIVRKMTDEDMEAKRQKELAGTDEPKPSSNVATAMDAPGSIPVNKDNEEDDTYEKRAKGILAKMKGKALDNEPSDAKGIRKYDGVAGDLEEKELEEMAKRLKEINNGEMDEVAGKVYRLTAAKI